MYLISGFKDINDLKFRIASDPTVISNLATFADILGFGWCGGTRSQYVGQDFDVSKQGDTYVMQAHYDPNDPHAGGYWADKRLRITLSNFRVLIDPGTMRYGTPQIKSLDPLTVSTVTAVNQSSDPKGDNVTTTFQYQLSESITHTTSFSFTEGVAVTIKSSAEIPGFGSEEVGMEFSFSATQGWSDSTQTMTSATDTKSYTGFMPAKTKRVMTLVAQRSQSDITYDTEAVLDFDIAFDGFLRWGGNARNDHPTDRPTITATFSGMSNVIDLYDHSNIPNYSQWDWAWVRSKSAGTLDSVMAWFRGQVGAAIHGAFRDVKGIDVTIIAGEPTPATPEELQTAAKGAVKLSIAAPAVQVASAGTSAPPPALHIDDGAPVRVLAVT